MMLKVTKAMLVALIVGVVGLAAARTADAAHVVIDVTAPDQIAVGQPAQLQALVRSADAGLPVANAAVTVYTEASFAGVEGEVRLGTALTDESGVATLTFEPRFASEHELRFAYTPPDGGDPEVFTKSISVVEGTSQLHQSTSGVEIPGLNVWLIIAVVSSVWFLLFSVAVRVFVIARVAPAVRGVSS